MDEPETAVEEFLEYLDAMEINYTLEIGPAEDA